MVDYNIAIPQQQLFQAPDFTQNAMRMQQMQMQEMQTQELARRRGEEAALRRITADPNSPEYAKQAMLVSPEFGLKAIAMQRQNTAADRAADASTRQAQEAIVRMANIRQTMGDTAYKSAQDTLAIVPPGDAEGYAKWYGQFKSAFRGMNLPTPEQWAQDTNGRLKGHMLATAESARALMTPKAPVYVKGPGDTNLRVDPDNPDLLRETNILEAGAPQPGAGAGRVDTYQVSPTRVANMNAAAGRTGGAPIVDDGGLAARADMGVNALVAGQRRPTTVVGNALAAPAAAASPYGELVQPPAARVPGVVGSREFAQRVEEKKLAEALKQEGLKTEARAKAELNVAIPEAKRLRDIGKQEFQGSLAAMVDQYKDLGRQGVLIEKGTSLGQRALTFAGAQAPGVAGVVSPEVGGPMQTLTNMRSTLLTGLMAATGMSAKQIDSNKEMQNYLDAMTSPGQTVKTITDTFNELSRKYGTGQTIKPEDISPPKSSSGIPSGRKSAAPARALNDMDQQALAWAKANPNDPRAGAINERLGAR